MRIGGKKSGTDTSARQEWNKNRPGVKSTNDKVVYVLMFTMHACSVLVSVCAHKQISIRYNTEIISN